MINDYKISNIVTEMRNMNNRILYYGKVKVKFSLARSLPVENLPPQNVGSIITNVNSHIQQDMNRIYNIDFV